MVSMTTQNKQLSGKLRIGTLIASEGEQTIMKYEATRRSEDNYRRKVLLERFPTVVHALQRGRTWCER